MKQNDKLEKDYQDLYLTIEHMAKEEVNKIREKTSAIKEEAGKIGEAVELSLNGAKRKQ